MFLWVSLVGLLFGNDSLNLLMLSLSLLYTEALSLLLQIFVPSP
jgi:hypothetical protein